MKLLFGRKSMVGAIGTLVAVGIGLAVLGAVGIVGWEYTNSDEFCAVMCHSVHRRRSPRTKLGACARSLRRVSHGAKLDTEADRDEADALQGTVGNDRRLRAAAACVWDASGARGVRELPLAADGASRQHHGEQALRHRFKERRDRLPDHAAHDRQRRARDSVEGDGDSLAHRQRCAVQEPGRAGRVGSVGAGHQAGWQQGHLPRCGLEAVVGRSREAPPRPMECFNCHNAVGHPFPNPADRVDAAIAAARSAGRCRG